MKYVFLAIFVLFSTQPMQTMSCDMHDAQQTSQHGSHDMDHGDDMNHGDNQDMDCCDHDPSVPTDNCDSMSHCGACPAGVLAFNSLTIEPVFNTNSRLYLPDTGEPLSGFSPPLFKPPIA
jgi:hypothetical protein